jgi:SAM-dependent methyltransferase
MSEAVDYFANHRLKLRFPWRLYHGPIVEALQQAIDRAPGPAVLNIGSGPFLEFDRLRTAGRQFTICDIDARAIDSARSLHGPKLHGADVLQPGAGLPYPTGKFDLAVAMDVIEHVAPPEPWLAEVVRVLRPGGALFLTTPNYASLSLRLLEHTALEAIARVQGFSRRGLHPTPLNPDSLRRLLLGAGCPDHEIQVISLGWVLAASARKPG